MTDSPERIYTWVHRDGDRMTHVWHGEDGGSGSGKTEYLRADHALSLVAEAYEVAAVIASDNVPATVKATAIRAMTPSDALAAREARDKRVRADALREAADMVVSRPGEYNSFDAADTIFALIEKETRPMTDDLKDRVMTLGYQGQTWVLAEDYRELEAEIEDAKATAHERGYYQGKAAGDDFGAAMREHVTRLEAENKALREGRGVKVDPLEVAELQSRLARLEADNAAATTWGAAVGARQEEIDATRKRLRALSPAPERED